MLVPEDHKDLLWREKIGRNILRVNVKDSIFSKSKNRWKKFIGLGIAWIISEFLTSDPFLWLKISTCQYRFWSNFKLVLGWIFQEDHDWFATETPVP